MTGFPVSDLARSARLSYRDRECASEVFSQYEGIDEAAFWRRLDARSRDTDRPSRAYDAAHFVATNMLNGRSDD